MENQIKRENEVNEPEEVKIEDDVQSDNLTTDSEIDKLTSEEMNDLSDDENSAEEEKTELAKAQEEIESYKDRLMRTAAEFDNYKKRTSREYSTLIKNANDSLITKLLPTLDNIERALQSPQTTEETKLFAQGIELIQQQLLDILHKEGLEEIDAVNQSFDPTFHEAVMSIEDQDRPADTVMEVVEKGYMINDKVLRPSKVVVTRT